jgi:hypothetical protein
MQARANPMEWQAMTNANISLVGGYCIVPDRYGHAVLCNTGLTLTRAQHDSVRHLNWLAENEPRRAGPSRAEMTAAIAAWRPAAVLTADGPDTRLGRYLIKFFGPPTVHEGAVLGWQVRPTAAAAPDTPVWTTPEQNAPVSPAGVR